MLFNNFFMINKKIINIAIAIGIVLLLLAVFFFVRNHKSMGITVEPSRIVIHGHKELLTVMISLDKQLGNASYIHADLLFNRSNPQYIVITDLFNNTPITHKSIILPNIKGAKALVQVFVNASLVEGQSTSNWWIDISLEYKNSSIYSYRLPVIVKK